MIVALKHKVRVGPQQREIQKEILQTMQAGVRGLNKENFIKKFYKQSKLGLRINFCPAPCSLTFGISTFDQ
ncbi:hypothetical protein HMPREF3132_09915 [Staphylococcus sp. HMSC14C08]|nr:hypothetical protein BBG12_02245 [Staphylococcus haemolyticus]OFV22936.1 hypothetical protein HMPREF3132_09915 [Staphylococcus sp. HMSC14C08]OHP57017.1 hypothetical protein HMPREF2627_10005 [Staphylococcus sp. HMSC061F10]OSO95115.1 hypothetical protein B9L24_02020 [Staphylococcus haemolyticus]PAK71109.1 hypothetical protein B8W97_00025 [Staphylococcus haemolyticus]